MTPPRPRDPGGPERGAQTGPRAAEPRVKQYLLAWAPAALTMAAIWLLSSSSAPGVPIDVLPFRDRGAHFLAYGTLSFFVAHAPIRTGERRRARVWLFAVYTAVLWGLLDEIHQAFVPGRSPDLVDLVADGLGASVGAFLRVLFVRRAAPAPATLEAAS